MSIERIMYDKPFPKYDILQRGGVPQGLVFTPVIVYNIIVYNITCCFFTNIVNRAPENSLVNFFSKAQRELKWPKMGNFDCRTHIVEDHLHF